jgi:ribosomal-protein-alanine N-acetyltransferase
MNRVVEPISIEPMRRADLDVVSRIDRRCYPTPWLQSAYVTELANPAAFYYVARMSEQVVGFGGAWVVGDEGHITTLAVDPLYQRRKIGERILLVLLEEAILRGASHLNLEVRESNRAAQNLYRKYGFREAAIRKNYYTDSGENAVVMWADDIRTPGYRQALYAQRQTIYQAEATSVY